LIGQPALQRRCGRGDGDNPQASQAVDQAFGHDTFHRDSVNSRLIQDKHSDVTKKFQESFIRMKTMVEVTTAGFQYL
jgi:hypothetical protein